MLSASISKKWGIFRMIKAIDISTWQRNVDFNKVKKSGISAVIIRAGFGRELSQKDSQFENHYKGAKAAGLKIGVYWYSYASTPTETALEAKTCLACIKGKSLDLPVYFDMEESWQTRLGRTTLTAMAESFCDTIKAGGYRAGVYSNLNWFANYLNYSRLRSKYSIWLAQWSSSHSLSCDIWQYADSGSVPGISGNVDMNIIENTAVIGGSVSGGTSSTNSAKEVKQVVTQNLRVLGKTGYSNSTAQVKTVQRLLRELGFKGKDSKALTVDGAFGVNTECAVKAFQTKNKATADGIVGSVTWKLLLGSD